MFEHMPTCTLKSGAYYNIYYWWTATLWWFLE